MAYGFYAECLNRYKGADAWRCFTDMFDYLPLAALIDDSILAIHGGAEPQALSHSTIAS
jgi:serine/threonine-protein phosphatase 2A catalytic subunit